MGRRPEPPPGLPSIVVAAKWLVANVPALVGPFRREIGIIPEFVADDDSVTLIKDTEFDLVFDQMQQRCGDEFGRGSGRQPDFGVPRGALGIAIVDEFGGVVVFGLRHEKSPCCAMRATRRWTASSMSKLRSQI